MNINWEKLYWGAFGIIALGAMGALVTLLWRLALAFPLGA